MHWVVVLSLLLLSSAMVQSYNAPAPSPTTKPPPPPPSSPLSPQSSPAHSPTPFSSSPPPSKSPAHSPTKSPTPVTSPAKSPINAPSVAPKASPLVSPIVSPASPSPVTAAAPPPVASSPSLAPVSSPELSPVGAAPAAEGPVIAATPETSASIPSSSADSPSMFPSSGSPPIPTPESLSPETAQGPAGDGSGSNSVYGVHVVLSGLGIWAALVLNRNFSRYVRFNTMQAIVLDVLLIFPDLLERSFNPKDGVGLDLLMSLDSTVFLFLLVCLVYGSSSCILGQLPRLPIVAEAAERQVL
uniref:Protein TIC 20 n=2 Tax=Cannabis sativa TaxID=3483 RepID=A0A803QCT0_CANSA